MTIFHFFKSVRAGVNLLAGSALILLLIKVLVLDDVQPLFPKAFELGQVGERLLASILASYVFYLIVIHAKEYYNRRTIYPYVLRQSSRVVGDCEGILSEISKASGVLVSLAEVNRTNLTTAFEKIVPASQAPLILGLTQPLKYANWIEYFSFHRSRSKQSLRRIFAHLIFLDAQLVNLISAIDDCSYFHYLESIERLPVGGKDLTHLTSIFVQYCEQCRSLSTYNSKALTHYVKNQ